MAYGVKRSMVTCEMQRFAELLFFENDFVLRVTAA